MKEVFFNVKNIILSVLIASVLAMLPSCENNYKKYPRTENISVPDIVIDSSFSNEEIDDIIFAIKEYNKAIPSLNLSYRIEEDSTSLDINFEKSSTKTPGLAGDAAKFYIVTLYPNNIPNRNVFKDVALHELGHFLGIRGHYNNSFMSAVMTPDSLYGCINEVVLEQICKTHNCENARPTCK